MIFAKDNIIRAYELRHLLIFIYVYIGLIYFYLTIKNIFSSQILGIVSVLLFILSPRFFAESFFNGKDLIVCAFVFINFYSLYKVLNNPTIFNIALHAFTSALIIDTRIIGIVYFLTFIGILLIKGLMLKDYKNTIKQLIVYLSVTLSFVIVFFPYLWTVPFRHLAEVFKNMSNFRHHGYVLLNGDLISEKELPIYYTPVWIAVTTPPFILLLFFIGIIIYLKDCIQNSIKAFALYFSDTNTLFIIYSCVILFGSLLGIAIFHSTLYNGWRQLYFLYPEIIIISIYGLHYISRLKKGFTKYINYTVISVCFIGALSAIIFIIQNHPYQNIYFNIFAKKPWNANYDLDYWSVSSHLAYKALLDQETGTVLYCNKSSIPQSAKILFKKEQQKRLKDVSCDIASYYINNFFKGSDNKNILSLKGDRIFELRANDQLFLEVVKSIFSIKERLDNKKVKSNLANIVYSNDFKTAIDNLEFFDHIDTSKTSVKFISLAGWFFNKSTKINTPNQRIVLLTNGQEFLMFKVDNWRRVDIGNKFKDNSLNMCGFKSYIDITNLNGNWKLHVGYLSKKTLFISPVLKELKF